MKQTLSYILSPLFHIYYALVFIITHPIQIVAHKIWGEEARLSVIRGLNFFLTKGLSLLGARISIVNKGKWPDGDSPIIIVANHQSFYDIPITAHLFRKNNVKFVAKASLGKRLPTISYNLKYGGSALIDRSNGGQAVRALFKLGQHIQEHRFAACIYPEGTRSPNGQVQNFQKAGLQTLLRAAPEAQIIPFAIKGHAALIAQSRLWLRIGQHLQYTIFPAINPQGKDISTLIDELRTMIKNEVE